jgi:acetolactate synthase-1/2/3 large subunit
VSRVADIVAETLHAHGVRHAFGMPGGEVVTVVDGLGRAGIAFTLARNETAAAMMAAGAAALAGAPGLIVTTLGPGLANAVNGIADAAQERVPLVVVSGVVERALRSRYTHQVVDHAALLAPLVKASFEIERDGAAATVARAIRLALAPPMGPVHLDLAPDVAAAAATGPAGVPPASVASPGVDPRSACLGHLAERLAEARRPIVVAGFEAARGGASEPLRRLLEAGVPVLTTYKAKGIVDERHPLALGAAGLSPAADAILKPVVARADLVLLAGYDPIEMRPGWLDPFADAARIVEISAHPPDHGMHVAGETLAGPVGSILAALANDLGPSARWPEGEPKSARAALEARFAPPAPWGPHAVVDGLAAALPADAVVTVDSGAHRILLSQRLKVSRPLSLLQSAGWCTMGAALPLAIGAKTVAPERPVVAVLGDGGLEMTLGELGTLRDAGLPVVVVVLQDGSLALIELKQAAAGLRRAGVGLGATRFEDVAAAFGGTGARVSDGVGLAAALAEAFARLRFSLIVAEIDARHYVDRI